MFSTGDHFRSVCATGHLPEPTMARLGDLRRAQFSGEVLS
jgi:hypothetical protein